MISKESARRTGVTLAAGTGGGLLFAVAGLPLPFLTGSAAATAAMALVGWRLEVLLPLRQAALILIGAMLGAGVTPETLALLPRWPITLVALPAPC